MADARARSTFVTVVRWIFLVRSVFSALVLRLRSAAVRPFFPGAPDILANSPEAANVAIQIRLVDVELVFLALLRYMRYLTAGCAQSCHLQAVVYKID
jgi:hypothetical protein